MAAIAARGMTGQSPPKQDAAVARWRLGGRALEQSGDTALGDRPQRFVLRHKPEGGPHLLSQECAMG